MISTNIWWRNSNKNRRSKKDKSKIKNKYNTLQMIYLKKINTI